MKKTYEVRYIRNDGTVGSYCGDDKEFYDAEIKNCENCGWEYTATIKSNPGDYIVQFSFDIMDCEKATKEDIMRILDEAGYNVYGCDCTARWTEDEYMSCS